MKALLIDDHPLILSAMQAVIRGLDNHTSAIGVGTVAAARAMLAADPDFDLVLLDLNLGETDGFDLLAEFRTAYPSLPIVVVSAADQRSDVLRAIDLGAMGFVPKLASTETLFEALRMVMSGGIYLPPMIMRSSAADDTAFGAERRRGPTWIPGHRAGTADLPLKPGTPLAALGLTPRQTDVLALLLEGQPNKLIARQLNLSVETIKDHVAAVLRTLNVNSRTQAVLAISEMAHQEALVAWREARYGDGRRGKEG